VLGGAGDRELEVGITQSVLALPEETDVEAERVLTG
jgi:hypothetical protein